MHLYTVTMQYTYEYHTIVYQTKERMQSSSLLQGVALWNKEGQLDEKLKKNNNPFFLRAKN